jgi:iron-sulfur cluster assembly protein|tara:strand:+ start:1727 stop:2047 length:321 start_codon:yes stop_codon:yes gene_type:complete
MLELTNTAIDYILKESMEMLDPAIRVGITNGGCGGSEYILEFADEINEDDHILDFEKFIIVIDQDSKPFIEGSTLDYVQEGLNQSFKFANPNVAMACGCGISVHFE